MYVCVCAKHLNIMLQKVKKNIYKADLPILEQITVINDLCNKLAL